MSRLNDYLNELESLNLQIRQRLELAELQVGTTNRLLAQLAASQLVYDEIHLGEVVISRPYSMRFDLSSSGEILQAALAVPGGFGAVFWDSEDLAALHQSPMLESEAMPKHVAFELCSPAIKALLIPQLLPLLERFMGRLARL